MITLRLPASRSGPLPSPQLAHSWHLDHETPPFLAPFIVTGLWMQPQEALPALLDLPSLERGNRNIVLAEDAKYWRIAASVVIETMAVQKVLPVVESTRGAYFARWQPVLDSSRETQRLAFLIRNMPAICRADIVNGNDPPPTSQALLENFLNFMVDGLARNWGWSEASKAFARPTNGSGARERDARAERDARGDRGDRADRLGDQPAGKWLRALFQANPTIKGSLAQLQSLDAAFRAWVRNLHLAGDSTFRIAFRLEPPGPRAGGDQPASQGEPASVPDGAWQLHYLLQARDDPSLLVPADMVWRITNGSLNQLGRRFNQPQEKLLAGLGYASRMFQPISASLKEKSPTHLALDTNQAYTFLREAAPILEEAGFGLLAPPWWDQPGARLGVRLRLKPTSQADKIDFTRGKLSLNRLVEYRWELSIGDTALTEEEFHALAALKTPLVQVRGQWVQLNPEQIEAAISFWEKQQLRGEISLLEALQMGANTGKENSGLTVDEVVAEDWLKDWMERVNQPGQMTELPQPAGLHGELRPYQIYGYSWLAFFRKWGMGACLADDMGLGKTVQTLALLIKEKENLGRFESPALLICPTSVVTNWEREAARFTPGLKTHIHQGPGRLRGEAFLQAIQETDLVLTSYVLARQDFDMINPIQWHAVILDEAQNIKNPNARQSQVVRKLSTDFRLALTGTPVENRLSELWSIMQFLNPGYLGTQESFRSRFSLPIERYNDQDAAKRLKKMVGPFILRRVKTDPNVIQDLPEKVETKVYCSLTEEQATLYQAAVEAAMEKVEESNGIGRRGNVLSMLMQLKQICNHPAQFLHEIRQGEAHLTNAVELAPRSGKLERLIEMLEEVLAEGDRTLIFTQFVEMGEMLASVLPQALNSSVLFLHGSIPAKARDGMIRRFQQDQNGPPIFILSLKAGGTGLNLTRANHVFHFDRWWNPAVENQATDRAFRIGQHRNVQVHKFITVGTLEEMIDEMIESKKGLADNIIGSGESWLTEMSTTDLRELVQLRKV
jgi:SNF2 family DNA or RNA helicase